MQQLTKGANAPLTAARPRVRVTCGAALDVSALLLAADGRVRSDADLVFYNAPQGPGVAFVPGSGGAPGAVQLDLAAVPADVERVAVTASLDGSGPATFGAAGPLAVEVLDDAGAPAVRFDVDGLSTERALLCLEVYRRAGAWKVRAVGQGWASGLAGLATDFGIEVDDPGPAAPQPPAAPEPTAQPGPGPAPRPASGVVNLDKGRVSLAKRQSVSLVKTGAPALTTVRMGLGWDPVRRGADVDLDASVIAFDEWGKDVEKVWFGRLTGCAGALQHSGDNLTGEGDGDDEVITVHLDGLPRDVVGLVFTVNSFRGQRFTELKTAYCRLLDERGTELVRYDLTETEPRTGVLLCSLTRQPDGTWQMTALGEFHDGRDVKKMVGPARDALARR